MKGGNKAKVDWNALEVEYINGVMSMRELAEAHGIGASGLFKRAAKGKWDEKRKQKGAEVSTAAQAILDQERPTELAKFNEDDLRLAKALRAQIGRRINKATEEGKPLTPSEIRLLATAAESAQRMGRLALGVTTANNGISAPDGGPVALTAEHLTPEQYEEIARKVLSEV